MAAPIFAGLLKLLPGVVGTAIGKIFGDKAATSEAAAQAALLDKQIELEHVQGWTKHGRMTPRIARRFVVLGAGVVLFLIFVISIIFPESVNFNFREGVEVLKEFFSTAVE